jgi:hypothetical protein
VSFLDKLKQDADQLRSNQNLSQAERDALVLETEMACLTAFRYWVDLSKQLNVLQSAPGGRFVLDSKNAIEGLRFSQYRADIRKKGLASTHDRFDHVALYCSLGTGQTLKLVKDFLPDMEKLEARQISTALLDELSKWLVGQPHDFVKRGKVLELKEV